MFLKILFSPFLKICYRLLLSLVIVSVYSYQHAMTQSSPLEMGYFQKGICYATWEKNKFATPYSDQALEMLKKMGVEYVQINVTQYVENYNSTKISPTECTATDASVKHAIQTAHTLGLKVMLKPHIDIINNDGGNYSRGDIGCASDAEWDKWFKEYNRFITHYAGIAETNKVEVFCVGTELTYAGQQTEKWLDLILSVKDTYKGKLIYAANWDDYKTVKFWEQLDYMGIDAYFPLTTKKNPAIADIKKGWDKWISEIEEWLPRINRPVVFTEIGYPSTPNANYEPWKCANAGNAAPEIQTKCYIAFFEKVWRCKWLGGVYWWKFNPTIYGGGENNRDYTPLNKPASVIMSEYYRYSRLADDKEASKQLILESSQKIDMLQNKTERIIEGSFPILHQKIYGTAQEERKK
ncbi:MAG: hypothetical protein HQL28_04490 [Candidatus Omnitrophica bacterium]|nr:hypothetical protein [Candidatus Omnitrophota bacterium]